MLAALYISLPVSPLANICRSRNTTRSNGASCRSSLDTEQYTGSNSFSPPPTLDFSCFFFVAFSFYYINVSVANGLALISIRNSCCFWLLSVRLSTPVKTIIHSHFHSIMFKTRTSVRRFLRSCHFLSRSTRGCEVDEIIMVRCGFLLGLKGNMHRKW